mmetsp:Transcript_33978/g.74523  ORF Transcript_33978/g.74523 Transcript_33978/m.74523 type:complete len:459 (-) Transcript_33978:51-1427(-)
MTKHGSNEHDRKDVSQKDRLLEKAKRFVEKQEGKAIDGRGGGGSKSRRKRSLTEDNRDRDGHRHRSRRDRDSSHRRRRDRADSRHRKRSRSRSCVRSEISDDVSDRSRSKKRRRHRRDGHSDDKDRNKKKKKHDDKKERKRDKKKIYRKRGKGDRKPKVELYPLGPLASGPPDTQIDPEADYFAYHEHFRLYLYRSSGTYFEDLSSAETHKEFAKFAKNFNEGKLEAGYYNNSNKIPPQAMEQCKRTQHKWAFKTNATEQQSLEMVRAGVRKQTEWSVENSSKPSAAAASIGVRMPALSPVPPRNNDGDASGHHRKTPEEIAVERAANRRLREHVKTTHEELTGGRADYGRERLLEKKRERAEQLHGSAKDREAEAMGGPDLDDEALYGGGRVGGGESFQGALAREKSRKAKREAKTAQRIEELQQKEDEKAKAMLDMLGFSGIKPGQKIKIAPRKDG